MAPPWTLQYWWEQVWLFTSFAWVMKDSCWSFLTHSILDLAVSISLQWGHPLRFSHWLYPLGVLGSCSQCSSSPFFTLHLELPLSQAAVFLLTAQSLVTWRMACDSWGSGTFLFLRGWGSWICKPTHISIQETCRTDPTCGCFKIPFSVRCSIQVLFCLVFPFLWNTVWASCFIIFIF